MKPAILVVALLLPLTLVGCGRTPYEEQVFEHARQQARLNAANFERTRDAREREQLQLRRRFEAAELARSDADDD